MKRSVYLLFIVIGYFYLLSTFSKMFLADLYYKSSKNLLENGQITEATQHIIKAIRYNPSEPAYKRQEAKVLLSTMIWQPDEEIKQKAFKDLKQAEELNPKNLATLRNVVPIYYLLAVNNIEKSAAPENVDQQYLQETQKFYKNLKSTYLNDLGVYTEIAEYEKKLGLTKDYQESYKKAQQLRPDIVEWHNSFQ